MTATLINTTRTLGRSWSDGNVLRNGWLHPIEGKMKWITREKVKLPVHRAGLPGKVISFSRLGGMPLDPAYKAGLAVHVPVKVGRVTCPWLVKNFVDKNAEFYFVPNSLKCLNLIFIY